MPYTMADFRREIREEVLSELTPEERLKGLPAEERLKGLPAKERWKGLTLDEILRSLPEDVLREIRKQLRNGNGPQPDGGDE